MNVDWVFITMVVFAILGHVVKDKVNMYFFGAAVPIAVGILGTKILDDWHVTLLALMASFGFWLPDFYKRQRAKRKELEKKALDVQTKGPMVTINYGVTTNGNKN